MHAGKIESSKRLQNLLRILLAYPKGCTTAEIQQWTGSMCPGTDVSELRQSGYDIECYYQGKSKTGRRIYRYKYLGRLWE